MKSPVGTHPELTAVQLEDGLTAYRCPETGGLWIPFDSYFRWLRANPSTLPSESSAEPFESISEDDSKPKLCPETGTHMFPYKVGHGLKFRIDRSQTRGIWLDGGEWEQLRQHNYHHQLHLIFGAPWQAEIRRQNRESTQEQLLQERFGDELLQELQRLKERLKGHPYQPEALAFLRE